VSCNIETDQYFYNQKYVLKYIEGILYKIKASKKSMLFLNDILRLLGNTEHILKKYLQTTNIFLIQ